MSRDSPESEDAAEQHLIAVKSLARLNRISEAGGEAEDMVNAHPGTPSALEVEQNTAAHPHRNP
jgi:hypothetical protein